jgi:EEF1A lysine methyltransferase 1
MASADAMAAVHITKFLAKTKERAEFNQYYYSKPTLEAMLNEIRSLGRVRIAFLSTPSVYFSLAPAEREGSFVFDVRGALEVRGQLLLTRFSQLDDEQFGKDPRFVKYDFSKPVDLPSELEHAFDMVVIDPPFITREVWEQYTETANYLLEHSPVGEEPRGKVLLSTIAENKEMMKELLDVAPVVSAPRVLGVACRLCPAALPPVHPQLGVPVRFVHEL